MIPVVHTTIFTAPLLRSLRRTICDISTLTSRSDSAESTLKFPMIVTFTTISSAYIVKLMRLLKLYRYPIHINQKYNNRRIVAGESATLSDFIHFNICVNIQETILLNNCVLIRRSKADSNLAYCVN